MCLAGWGASMEPNEEVLEERFEHVGLFSGFGDELLRLDTIKFMPDGGMGDRTALMFEPYLDEPDNFGQFVVSESELPGGCAGFTIAAGRLTVTHAATVCRRLSSAPTPLRRKPTRNSRIRHRIHHGYFPTEKTLEIMREHRFPALATIPFVTNLGESYVASVGEERAARTMPLRTYLDAGVPLALGSDSPVTTYNPFVGIYSATTRKTVTGRELGPEECLSREEALRLYTATSAWVTFEDDIKGTLTPGKLADIAVLDRDLFVVADEELFDITSSLTVVGGQVVHDTLG